MADPLGAAPATGQGRLGRPAAADGLLGVFPAPDFVGGVQASGRLAWEVIVEELSPRRGAVHLFCYGRHDGPARRRVEEYVVHAGSPAGAALAAFRRRWPVRAVLVWHLSLMKLLPFFRLSNAKVAVFLHGIEAWRPQDRLARALLRRVDLFLSNSDHTWQRFRSANPHYPRVEHRTVRLGVSSPVSGSLPAPEPRPAALMLSRLRSSEDYKGHREVIDAWPLVLERTPDAELWIAGDGELRQSLAREVAARGLGRRVRFWGRVSEAEKGELLARCRCLALPSRGEGFGLVYIEAMRSGRPCLVSMLDAGREVVNPPEAGLAADIGDRRQIAEAMCRLLSPGSEWDTWSQRARVRYEAHFTAQRFQQRLLGALRPLFT